MFLFLLESKLHRKIGLNIVLLCKYLLRQNGDNQKFNIFSLISFQRMPLLNCQWLFSLFFSSLLSFQMQHCYISLHSVKIWKKCTHIFVVMENSIPFSVLRLKTFKVLGKKIRRKEICAAYTFHWIEMRGCVDKASTKWAKPTSLHDE